MNKKSFFNIVGFLKFFSTICFHVLLLGVFLMPLFIFGVFGFSSWYSLHLLEKIGFLILLSFFVVGFLKAFYFFLFFSIRVLSFEVGDDE